VTFEEFEVNLKISENYDRNVEETSGEFVGNVAIFEDLEGNVDEDTSEGLEGRIVRKDKDSER